MLEPARREQSLIFFVCRLSRKLKEAEARFETSASSYEQEHSELESRLEEVGPAALQLSRAFLR